MASIRIPRFGALGKAVTDRNLPTVGASEAHNAELRDGSLRAFRAPLEVTTATAAIGTVFETTATTECCSQVLTFDTCVSVTEPMDMLCRPGIRTIVWPEDGTAPYWLDCDTGAQTPLEVPAPTRAASAARTSGGSSTNDPTHRPDQRAYTYTFVNSEGLESAPAQPSNAAPSRDGEVWEVLGDPLPPAGIVAVRIYRTTSPADTSEVAASSFQLVDEVAVASWNGSYRDNDRLRDILGGALNTVDLCPPPAGLCDVHQLDSGYHVGFVGDTLRFSERHEPHNWPERNTYQLPCEIRGVAVNNDLVYVGTSAHPYLARTGVTEDTLTGDVVLRCDIARYDQMYPMVGRRTITATAWGAAYVGREGIVGLQPSLPARIVSRDRIDEDLWLRYVPNRIAWRNGRIYAGRAPAGIGFILDVRGEPEGPRDLGDFVTIDFAPTDIHATPSGRLLYAEGDTVFEWDSPFSHDLMRYRWKSRRFITPGHVALNAGKVVADYGTAVSVKLERDEVVALDRDVQHRRPFRLPRTGRGLQFVITLEGTATVHEVHFATSVAELSLTYEEGNV